MQRLVDYRYSEVIGSSFNIISPTICQLLEGIHFFVGTDPIYAGLHNYIDTEDGRSLRNTAHCCYPWNMIDKKPVIVLPEITTPDIVVHELGHYLDFLLGFRHNAIPINEYAKTNRREAFAEAFTARYFYLSKEANDIYLADKSTHYLFECLGA